MSKPRKQLSKLIQAVHADALARVSLNGVDRSLLLQPMDDEFASSGNRQTTLAHQFGRMRQLHRIQPLLLSEDYDFNIEIRRQFHEPPLFCFVDTPESVALVPQDIFTETRLFAQYEAEGPLMWVQRLVMSNLIDRVPQSCFSKENLLKPYFPDHLATTVLATLIDSGQTQHLYPDIVSSTDIISSEFSQILL